jgi:hypothetical protein
MLLFATSAAPSFNGGNAISTDLYTLVNDISAITTDVSPTAGGTLTINGNAIGSYDYTVKNGNQTVSSFSASDWFTSTQDTRSALIVVNGNLTINSGQTFIPSVRKLFTCIYVNGNLTLNGSISMSLRGANHSGSGNSGGLVTEQNIRIINGTYSSVTNPTIPAVSTGGAGNTGAGGNGGTGSGSFGVGANGTCFGGGSGGGGPINYVAAPVYRGGAGGDSYEFFDGLADPNTYGAGAGNPGGQGNYRAAPSPSGTGGTLIVFVRGTLTGSGSFVSVGATGGDGSSIGPARRFSHGGGGSGGGSINIIATTDSSSTTMSAAGGAGGPGNSTGTGGGYSDPGSNGATGTARKLTLV